MVVFVWADGALIVPGRRPDCCGTASRASEQGPHALPSPPRPSPPSSHPWEKRSRLFPGGDVFGVAVLNGMSWKRGRPHSAGRALGDVVVHCTAVRHRVVSNRQMCREGFSLVNLMKWRGEVDGVPLVTLHHSQFRMHHRLECMALAPGCAAPAQCACANDVRVRECTSSARL